MYAHVNSALKHVSNYKQVSDGEWNTLMIRTLGLKKITAPKAVFIKLQLEIKNLLTLLKLLCFVLLCLSHILHYKQLNRWKVSDYITENVDVSPLKWTIS